MNHHLTPRARAARHLRVPRRVPVTWQESSWRARVVLTGPGLRLQPHHISVAHRAELFTLHPFHNHKHLLRRISL
jgi:hypothetical protein